MTDLLDTSRRDKARCCIRRLAEALRDTFEQTTDSRVLRESADVIWKQLTMSTKMAVGAREPTAINNGKDLVFKAGRSKYVLIAYNQGTDEYDIELFRYGRGSKMGKKIVEKSVEGIQVDNLNSVIYDLVNK